MLSRRVLTLLAMGSLQPLVAACQGPVPSGSVSQTANSREYRDYAQFNFGTRGAAAGLGKNALLALAQASKPNAADLGSPVARA